MLSEIVIGGLIAGVGTILGAIIGIIGQIVGNCMNHKKEIERMAKEFTFREKIEAFKKIHEVLYDLRIKVIDFILGESKDKPDVEKMIGQINKEAFLFSDKDTLSEIKNNLDLIRNNLNISFTIKKGEDLQKITLILGTSQGNIIKAIRKELKL